MGTLSLDDLRLAVETAKRILSKDKTDRQLAGQLSSTPFMNIKDGYNSKRVTLDMQDRLEEKIDKLTLMMNKLAAQDNNQNKQFKPKIYQNKWRGQSRNFYDRNNCAQRNYQNIGQITEIEEHQAEVGVSMDKIIEDKISEVDTEGIIDIIILEEVGVGLETRQYSDNFKRNNRYSSSRSRSGSRACTNRDRIRCYRCMEYDHFAMNCPTLQIEKQPEQIKQMYNMAEEHTALKF